MTAPADPAARLHPGTGPRPDGSAIRQPRTRLGYRFENWQGWRSIAKYCGVFAIAMIYVPLVWLMVMSVSSDPFSGIPWPLSTTHFRMLFTERSWVGPLGTSLGLSLAVALSCIVCATLVGRAVTRSGRPGRILILMLLPLFVPGLTMGTALFVFFRTVLDLRPGLWTIYLAQLIWALPFCLLLVLVSASRFDLKLLDAAQDLGASPWKTFWQIELPILRPAIAGSAIFGFLLSFNELPRSLFVRGTETTMPIYNWAMAASQQSMVPVIFSLTTLTVLLTLPLVGGLFWLLFVRLDRS